MYEFKWSVSTLLRILHCYTMLHLHVCLLQQVQRRVSVAALRQRWTGHLNWSSRGMLCLPIWSKLKYDTNILSTPFNTILAHEMQIPCQRATSRGEMLKVTPIFSSMEGSHQSVTYFSKKRCDKARHGFSRDFSQNQESMSPCLYASFEGSFRNWELRLFSTERSIIRLRQNLLSEFGELLRGHSGLPPTQLRLTWFKRGHKTSRGIWESRDTVRTLPTKFRIRPCVNEDSNHCCDCAIILFTYI